MKYLNISGYIGDAYYCKKVKVDCTFLKDITNNEAISIMSQQCMYPDDKWVEANDYVLLFIRNDIPNFIVPELADPSMSLSAVCSGHFSFMKIDKEYLLEVLEGKDV